LKIEFVLDASAILAIVLAEPGSEFVHSILDRSAMTAVNYTAVLTRMMRQGVTPSEAVGDLGAFEVAVIPWDKPLAVGSADLCPLAWTHGLSLGDRACLTLARSLGVTAVTADMSWRRLTDVDVRIHSIR